MYSTIYRILEATLGVSKQGYYSSDTQQYQFNCPCCAEENGGIPDMKYNLEVNLQIGKYHCWRCAEEYGTKGKISKLVLRYGGAALYNDFKDEAERINVSKLYSLDYRNSDAKQDDEVTVYLPKSFEKIDISTCRDRMLKDYLTKRRIGQDIIDKFGIGVVRSDRDYKMKNRIIIPSYNSFGELNYYVGRDFTGKSYMKYRNCDADKKLICFQESHINWDSDIVLVEGAIDCLYYPNSISLLGKALSRDSYLFKSLVKKANARIIIALDSDTDINETKRVYSLLNFGRLIGRIRYIRMYKYKDFGDAFEKGGKSAMMEIMHGVRTFSDFELIF